MLMQRVTVYLAKQQVAGINELAEQTGVTFAEMLRRILNRAIPEEKKREQLLQGLSRASESPNSLSPTVGREEEGH